jgi:AbrB family looped-hinge helix DNA binding protein
MALVTIQAEGQMTIPQSIREALDIKAGTRLVRSVTKADAREAAMKQAQRRFPSPREEELTRRQALMANILAR